MKLEATRVVAFLGRTSFLRRRVENIRDRSCVKSRPFLLATLSFHLMFPVSSLAFLVNKHFAVLFDFYFTFRSVAFFSDNRFV